MIGTDDLPFTDNIDEGFRAKKEPHATDELLHKAFLLVIILE